MRDKNPGNLWTAVATVLGGIGLISPGNLKIVAAVMLSLSLVALGALVLFARFDSSARQDTIALLTIVFHGHRPGRSDQVSDRPDAPV